MSAFTDLLTAGHAVFLTQAKVAVVRGAVTKYGVPSSQSSWSDEDEQGYLVQADGSVTLLRQEVIDLGLVFQAAFTVSGVPVRVVRITGDEIDPTQEVIYRHAR